MWNKSLSPIFFNCKIEIFYWKVLQLQSISQRMTFEIMWNLFLWGFMNLRLDVYVSICRKKITIKRKENKHKNDKWYSVNKQIFVRSSFAFQNVCIVWNETITYSYKYKQFFIEFESSCIIYSSIFFSFVDPTI